MVPPISVLSLVTAALETLGIRYVLVGSFASSIHGLYRATADIDIVAEIKAEQIYPLHEALQDAFYVDELAMRNAVAQKRSFNAIHFDSVFKVDIFVAQEDEFASAQLDRRQLRKISPDRDESVYVASPEDTILAKLRWYRAGNESSTNQWNDVLGILGIMRDSLDVAYLRMWAERLRVGDLLERAFEETKT
ncbi:MAG TPA: DUF6036 family nucleotidyltransferase [Pyrinomonadaceae bacterium]